MRLAPERLSGWAEAMAREAGEIERPDQALIFAFGCAIWALKAATAEAVHEALTNSEEGRAMTMMTEWPGRGVAIACAVAATSMGLAYLVMAGAPARMLVMNASALVAGLIVILPFLGKDPLARPGAGVLALVAGLALLATAGFGDAASGVRRWVSLGGVVFQPSLILVPLLITSFARSRNILTASGLVLAAVAMAWQPDRAMAGAVVAGVGAVALMKRDRMAVVVLAAALVALVLTALQPDEVPPTPFVDRVFRTALSGGLLSAIAVWGGAMILLVPALMGLVRDRSGGAIHAAFGATWLAIIIAAVVADYPTPLVAYGGSAIVGYLLAVLGLPRRTDPVIEGREQDGARALDAPAGDLRVVAA